MSDTRTCSGCRAVLPVSAFAPSSRSSDGLTKTCVACRARRAAAQRKSYAAHRAKRIAEVVKWRHDNAERVRVYDREYYARNCERKRELARDKLKRDKLSGNTAADRITPSYIANVWKIGVGAIPETLIEAQRAHLQLKRALKEIKT